MWDITWYQKLSYVHKTFKYNNLLHVNGGERGIRTPGTVSGSVVFKTTAIDHSAISPYEQFSHIQVDSGTDELTRHRPNYDVFGAVGDNRGDSRVVCRLLDAEVLRGLVDLAGCLVLYRRYGLNGHFVQSRGWTR
jgi:hypothetical protein